MKNFGWFGGSGLPPNQADIELAIPRGGQHKGFRWGSQDIPFREGSLLGVFLNPFLKTPTKFRVGEKKLICNVYGLNVYTYKCDLPGKILGGLRWY